MPPKKSKYVDTRTPEQKARIEEENRKHEEELKRIAAITPEERKRLIDEALAEVAELEKNRPKKKENKNLLFDEDTGFFRDRSKLFEPIARNKDGTLKRFDDKKWTVAQYKAFYNKDPDDPDGLMEKEKLRQKAEKADAELNRNANSISAEQKSAPAELILDPVMSNLRPASIKSGITRKEMADINKAFGIKTVRKPAMSKNVEGLTAAEERALNKQFGTTPKRRTRAQIDAEAKEKKSAREKKLEEAKKAREEKIKKIEEEKIETKKRICDADILRLRDQYLKDIENRREACKKESIKAKMDARKKVAAAKKN